MAVPTDHQTALQKQLFQRVLAVSPPREQEGPDVPEPFNLTIAQAHDNEERNGDRICVLYSRENDSLRPLRLRGTMHTRQVSNASCHHTLLPRYGECATRRDGGTEHRTPSQPHRLRLTGRKGLAILIPCYGHMDCSLSAPAQATHISYHIIP